MSALLIIASLAAGFALLFILALLFTVRPRSGKK